MASPAEVNAAISRLEIAMYVARVTGGRAAEQELTNARRALHNLLQKLPRRR